MSSQKIIVFILLAVTIVASETKIYNGTLKVSIECPLQSERVGWSKDNKTLEGVVGYTIEKNKLTFTISKATLGVYVCTTPEEGSREVDVLSKPLIDGDVHQHKNAIVDETFVYECKGYGMPVPVVQWMKDNQTIEFDDPAHEDARVMVKNSTTMTNAMLRIKRVTETDGGDYICVASNEHGTFEMKLSVSIKDKYAALWPFLGICVEVAVLCAIILLIEKRRSKKEEKVVLVDGNDKSPSEGKQTEELRQRKI